MQPNSAFLRNLKRIFDYLTIGLFLAAISLPLLVMLRTPAREESEVERRFLAHEVEFDANRLSQSIDSLENYLEDQIGFREDIIYWNNRLKIEYLDYSPVNLVVVGKDGWLYYGDEIPSYRHEIQFTDQELRLMCQTLEVRSYWLGMQGIDYVFSIAPNKSTIYPEYVPAAYTKINQQSAFDQLTEYLQQNCNVHFIDLREDLLEEKERQQIYFVQDTHWNFIGAYTAYQAIMEYIAAHDLIDGAELTEEAIVTSRRLSPLNDLAGMTGFPEAFPQEYTDLIEFAEPCEIASNFTRLTYITVQTRVCTENTYNVLLLRDSFGGMLTPFFAEQFLQTYSVEAPYSHALVKELLPQNQPQIVVDEVVERNLRLHFLDNTAADFQATSQEIFGILPHSYGSYKFNNQLSELTPPMVLNAPATFADYGLHIRASDSESSSRAFDPQIIFSLPAISANEMIVVRIWLSMPHPTTLEVLYAGSDSVFDTQHTATISVTAPGQYEFYLAIQPSDAVSFLRIDPGDVPGDYIIHEVEIRSSTSEP